ncbi:MAG: nuclease A inhibitor family protein [Elusimicrobiota bacterium]
MTEDPLLALRTACAGLLFPSESEFPLEVFAWKEQAGELNERTLLSLAGRPADAPVARGDVDGFFKNAVAESDWNDEAERAVARRFQNLLQVLKSSLAGVSVFRVGEIEIDVYIVGRTPGGDWAGLRTKVIET